ncbi:MAG TPA: DsrE family protein [Holophagaceae bacterium]|nr:DsrE family protein [Holophagaceae bacterium]
MSKTAIVLFSDPKAGTEEALGRCFNALFLTYDLKERGEDVALIFQGAGVRWATELTKADHPAAPLFRAVHDKVAGVCGGCADVFSSAEEVQATGLTVGRDLQIPGTKGVISLAEYLAKGYTLVTL